jgi:HD-GYP domain-containing protein (c-di-GMP phosphodiesterase class II)
LVHGHPVAAGEALRRSPSLPTPLSRIAERHHERLDGSGYPLGLAGAAIDEASLLCAIADVHTALTDRRPYRHPLDDAAAFARLHRLAGRQLEPGLLRRYEEVIRDERAGG